MLGIIQVDQMQHEQIRLFMLNRVGSALGREIIQVGLGNPLTDLSVFQLHLDAV
ncbi:hypothetical protein D3C75_1247500 [compost metagenome]